MGSPSDDSDDDKPKKLEGSGTEDVQAKIDDTEDPKEMWESLQKEYDHGTSSAVLQNQMPDIERELSSLKRIRLIRDLVSRFESAGYPVLRLESQAFLWLADEENLQAIIAEIDEPPILSGANRDRTYIAYTTLAGIGQYSVANRWAQSTKESASVLVTPVALTPAQAAAPPTDSSTPTTPFQLPASRYSPFSQDLPSQVPSVSSTRSKRPKSETRTLSNKRRAGRDQKVANLVKNARDMGCILTNEQQALNSCHLFPFCMRDLAKENIWWQELRLYFGGEKVDRWQRALYCDPLNPNLPATERLENLITLSSNAHIHHTKCLYAIQHIRTEPDRKSMQLKMHWLNPLSKVTEEGACWGYKWEGSPPHNFALEDGSTFGAKLYDYSTDKPIRTGHKFVITTEDPGRLPLPNEDILDLQWHMQKVAALAGAADPVELEDQDDDDELVSISDSCEED